MYYTIRTAVDGDLEILPSIELAASELFRDTEFAEETSYCSLNAESLKSLLDQGGLWVADFEGRPVGFAVVMKIGRNAHIDELDVHPAHQRKGLGRRLVEAVCDWAASAGYSTVSLSTYRTVPWNGPFYRQLGFEVIEQSDLTDAYRELRETESRLGLSVDQRTIMKKSLIRDQEKA